MALKLNSWPMLRKNDWNSMLAVPYTGHGYGIRIARGPRQNWIQG